MKGFNEVPKLLAFSVPNRVSWPFHRRHLRDKWVVPCPFCGRVHLHGFPEGRRVAHCPPDNQHHAHGFEGRERPESYEIVYGGEAPRELIGRVTKSKRRSQTRCSR